MKKATFLIIGIIYSIECLGQQIVSINDVANIQLPDGAVKINREQALSHAAAKFNNDKITLQSIARRRQEHMYKIHDILISLFTDTNHVKKGHLLADKDGFDAMFTGNITYKSSLKIVNNNSVLVLNDITGNIENYYLYCYNAGNSRALTGVLEFDKADHKEATAILDQLINSIAFK